MTDASSAHTPPAQDPVAGPAAPLAPVKPSERLLSLDVIRGFAVLGILAVNATVFAQPYAVMINPPLQPGGLEGEAIAAWQAMWVFFQDKMRTLFSMLFGVSIFLIGGQRSDAARGKLLRRRLFWLALFGLLHGLAFWYGDILLLYAWAGVFVMLVRSWSARRLLVVGVLLNLVCSGLYVGMMSAMRFAPPEALDEAMANSGYGASQAQIAEMIADFRGGPLEVSGAVVAQWLATVPMFLIFMAPATAALMMIGLGLFKAGVLAGRAPTWLYAAFIAAGAAALALIWRESAGIIAGGFDFLDATIRPANTFLSPLVSLGYAGVLILLIRFGGRLLLAPFAAAGRMAFTNYLTQTLIMTTIFYGGRGLGWYGQVGWPEMWGIIVAVWALQLVWSPLWLARFQMGPFEWVWRCLTYGRRVPLSKAAA